MDNLLANDCGIKNMALQKETENFIEGTRENDEVLKSKRNDNYT